MTFMTGLQCHLCGAKYPAEALWVCGECLGPLEVVYDYDGVREAMTRDVVESRPRNVWRFRELLPIVGEPRTGFHSGYTPLVKADRLARKLGLRELYLKDDSVNHPTLSYKDRVVSMAATRAVELGFTTFGCASTGNLANSVSAHAARLGLECYVFIPCDLELGKVLGSAVFKPHVIGVRGNYDDMNRLCTQIAEKHGWGFANINLRSYYAEGAKTHGFEVVEQLGWRFPQHLVSPVAGGTLLPRIARGFRELRESALSPVSSRGFTRPRPPGVRPWFALSRRAWNSPSRSSPRPSLRRLRSGILPTVSRSSKRCVDRRIGRGVDGRRDPAGDGVARRDRRHLHRTGGRRDACGRPGARSPRHHPRRRIGRHLRHRQRLQDRGGNGRSAMPARN